MLYLSVIKLTNMRYICILCLNSKQPKFKIYIQKYIHLYNNCPDSIIETVMRVCLLFSKVHIFARNQHKKQPRKASVHKANDGEKIHPQYTDQSWRSRKREALILVIGIVCDSTHAVPGSEKPLFTRGRHPPCTRTEKLVKRVATTRRDEIEKVPTCRPRSLLVVIVIPAATHPLRLHPLPRRLP